MIKQFFTSIFSGPLAKAVSHTLLYSLEVGVLIAALTGLVIVLTKKTPASVRYRLLCSLLALFAVLMISDLYKELARPAAPVNSASISQNQTAALYPAASVHSFGLSTATDLFDKYSGWIFALWFIICLFKSIKLTRQLLYIKTVRTVGVRPITDALKIKLKLYKEKLGIDRIVTMLESELVKVPVTFGYLRPVILLPAGIILQLSQEQIESIIWHELAHIKRRDYLAGLLQSIIETLFFFNPAIRWLSALIREEREACCDDLVLGQIKDKRSYLSTLIAFQNIESTSHTPALGLSFGKDQLLNRLKRMVNSESPKLNSIQKTALLFSLSALFIFTFCFPLGQGLRKKIIKVKAKIAVVPAAEDITGSRTAVRQQPQMLSRNASTHYYHTVIIPANDTILPKALTKVATKNALYRAPVSAKAALLNVEPEPKFKMEKAGDKQGGDNIENDKQRMRGVIAMLVEARVVDGANDIQWFGLSDTELIVNGQKLSSALQQQLKEKYGVSPQNGLYYGPVKMIGMGAFFDKRDL